MPKSVSIFLVNLQSFLDVPWDLDLKLVIRFNNPVIDWCNEAISFLESVRYPPWKGWLCLQVKSRYIFSYMYRMRFLQYLKRYPSVEAAFKLTQKLTSNCFFTYLPKSPLGRNIIILIRQSIAHIMGAGVIESTKSSLIAASNSARLVASDSFVTESSIGLNLLRVRLGTIWPFCWSIHWHIWLP